MGTDGDAPPGTARGGGEPRRGQSREVARITAFSDGVFAIAITLLALPLALPRGDGVEVWAELQRLGPSFRSFCISFVVIGAYWIGHRGIFLLVERSDRRLLWLNLLLLFFIVLLPFTTSLVGEHGDQRIAVAVYALSVAGAGFAAVGLAVYALGGRRLSSSAVDEREVRLAVWRNLVTALVFVASLALLPLGATVVEFSWLSVIVAWWLVRRRHAGIRAT